MSPSTEDQSTMSIPPATSTPLRPLTNGHDTHDSKRCDSLNGNVNVNIVSESCSMDVLSGGESDAGDTLNRKNNNSLSSNLTNTLRESASEPKRRVAGDFAYFAAKELLMTERTFKRDLELVTVTWASRVQSMTATGTDVVPSLARAYLALTPFTLLPSGVFLARLEKTVAAQTDDKDEPEHKSIAEILYDYLLNTIEAYEIYTERAGTLVGGIENIRRRSPVADKEVTAFDATSPLPLACLLLRPLHRLLHLERLAIELSEASSSPSALKAMEIARRAARRATEQLRHVENHAVLCQLQRDILGYDKLLVPGREFIRHGCVYKHSTRGLQQRMLFLFNDVLILASKSGSSQFRSHAALPLHALEIKATELPHSFTLTGEDVNLLLSASNDVEFGGWLHAFEIAIEKARENPATVHTEVAGSEQDAGMSSSSHSLSTSNSSGGALTHVCWHRVTSLSRDHLHLATRTQLSGYLLRKFKNSHGWQKLWVVFAAFTLFFYKSWQDEQPLASLPLLGYNVGKPAETDAIQKDFVFKLQFKNHVYFFRADSQYTYSRWVEVLRTAMVNSK